MHCCARPNEQAVAGVPRNTKLVDLLLTLVAMTESSATKQKYVVVDTFDARVRDKDQAPEFLRQHGLGRPCKPDDGDNQMKEKDDDIAHPGMISKPEKHLILAVDSMGRRNTSSKYTCTILKG
jgi:hypothetical protein